MQARGSLESRACARCRSQTAAEMIENQCAVCLFG